MTQSQKAVEAPMWKIQVPYGEENSHVGTETASSRSCSKGVASDEPPGGFTTSIFFLSLLFSQEVRNGASGGRLSTLRSNAV